MIIPERSSSGLPDVMKAVRERTPARILSGHAGTSYRTATQLELRQDHAAAVDAVHREMDLLRDFGHDFVEHWRLFEVCTCARSKSEFLLRPDFGRCLSDNCRTEVARHCPRESDLQVAIGDGLSATAVAAQVPSLLPLIERGARERGWSFGQPCVIRYCRVGVLNDLGSLLDPMVAVLLIGERPGLVTSESLSAYMAYRPRPGHTDAQRNLVCNIHGRGVGLEAAAQRILALAAKMRQHKASGFSVKEDLPTLTSNDQLPSTTN